MVFSEAGSVRDDATPPLVFVVCLQFYGFSQELVDLQGVGGRNLEFELNGRPASFFAWLCFSQAKGVVTSHPLSCWLALPY